MKRPMHAVLAAILIALGLWALGLVRFIATLPSDVTDNRTRTDAIVVLTGGSDRLATGLRLLREDYAGRLLISGVAESLSTDRLLEQLGLADYPADLRHRIVLGHTATNTIQNAQETADWCRQEGVRSIRLVTAAYHMNRSLLELQRTMPGVRIISHPVFPDAVKQGQWWKYPGTLLLLAREYSKFLAANLIHMFGLTPEE
ncbi:MAG: YdcF family protein [Rhodospirillaceae bacterium]|nr:YdcF family protein [Rhodospirillaceae bacterium]